MTTTNRIEVSPKVMMGKPVIRGTRIPVELILRKLGEGATQTDLLDAYPRLTKADLQAAIGYAAGPENGTFNFSESASPCFCLAHFHRFFPKRQQLRHAGDGA